MEPISGATIAVYALISAVVAATATTAIRAATGGVDDANDAFGDWLKSFFTSFALGTATGAAGQSVSGAEFADVGAAEIGAATESAGAGAQAATAEMAAGLESFASDYAHQTLFPEVATEPVVQSSAMETLDSWLGGIEGFDATKFIAGKLGVQQPEGWEKFSDVGQGVVGFADQPEQRDLGQDRLTDYMAKYLASAGTAWGTQQKAGLKTGLEEELKKYEPTMKPQELTSSLSGGFGYEWF